MSLTPTILNKNKLEGFTLVELLVSISMMAIVTASVFGFSRNSENQNNLNRAKERLMFELKRAESLAMSNSKNTNDTRSDPGKWVQWGVAINDNESYRIESRTCPSGALDADKGACSPKVATKLEDIQLPSGITITSPETSIYFLAPEPAVYKENGKLNGDSTVAFTLQYNHNTQTQKTVIINSIGQVNGD